VLLAGFEEFAARMQDAVGGGDSNKVITVLFWRYAHRMSSS
jgi:hypothetical protein